MKQFILIAVFSILACACGASIGGESAKMDIKIGGKDASLAVKSSGTNPSVKTFTDKEGKVTTASSFYIIAANYDMDTASVASMRKPVTAADQVRMALQLIGAEGTNDKAELKPGIYKADTKEKFMKVDSLIVSTFADGKETNTSFETMSSTSKISGQVEIKSVTADAISGTIDVTDGDKSVKGSFTAKVTKK